MQQSFLVQLPEKDLFGSDKLGDAPRQPAVEVGQPVAGSGVPRHREQRVDSRLMSMLDPLRALGPLLIDEPLSFAAVKVRPQVHQGVDHLLTTLA